MNGNNAVFSLFSNHNCLRKKLLISLYKKLVGEIKCLKMATFCTFFVIIYQNVLNVFFPAHTCMSVCYVYGSFTDVISNF